MEYNANRFLRSANKSYNIVRIKVWLRNKAKEPGFDLDCGIEHVKKKLLDEGYSESYVDEICNAAYASYLGENDKNKIPPKNVETNEGR